MATYLIDILTTFSWQYLQEEQAEKNILQVTKVKSKATPLYLVELKFYKRNTLRDNVFNKIMH